MDTINIGLGAWRGLLARLAGQTHGGARDLYKQFGYHREITIEHLYAAYLRGGIASRIIRAFPAATWTAQPIVRDEKGDSSQEKDRAGKANKNYSPFVASVETLFDRLCVPQVFERADRLSGAGEFSILVMGFAGGDKMEAPLGSGARELLFLQPYAERNITVSRWETKHDSPRFGMPEIYTVKQERSHAGGAGGGSGMSFNVHHSRVLHVAEQIDDNEIFGIPRLYPVMNYLMDLEKTTGAGAETYWLNARQGLAFVGDPKAELTAEALADMKKQADEYEHELRRVMAMQGVTPHVLNAAFHDPGPYLDKLLDLIAGTVGIPKRILIGSERGELSSGQDENNWASRIDERRKDFAGPKMVKPFIEAMIVTGNLPNPDGEFWIEWPPAGAVSEEKRATISKTLAEALAAYANAPNAMMIVPPQEFRTDFLGLTPESEYELPEELEPIDEGEGEGDDLGEGEGEGDDISEAAE